MNIQLDLIANLTPKEEVEIILQTHSLFGVKPELSVEFTSKE